jgi:acyl-coenzyme A synthetase/AMP-(fatty) acid ligase
MININNEFLTSIKNIPGDRVFLSSGNERILYKDIFNKINLFESEYSFLKGKNCAVKSNDRATLAVYIPAIVNLAGNIFLQPNNLSEDEVNKLYHFAEIDCIVELDSGLVNVKKIKENVEKEKSGNCKWVLATSGTTSTPKLASYKFGSLTSTVVMNVDKGADYIWGLNYDLNRFAGLQVYFQAILSGSTLVVAESNWSVEVTATAFVTGGVNVMSATPSFWRRLLMCASAADLPLKRITLGGEISSQFILSALQKAYPSARIIHIYASTEAGVGFTVRDGLEGFPVKLLESGEGVELKIENGTLWIKSKRASDKLLKGKIDTDSEGYIDSGDLVKIKGNRVYFLGRNSGAINVGGNKVIPEEIETIINSLDYVLEARVYGKSSSILGMIVAADVVVCQPNSLDKKEIKRNLIEYCRARLESFKVPAMLKFVDSIEVNETGKVQR